MATNGHIRARIAKVFEEEYEAITQGRRSPKWVQGHKDRLRLHLLPYLGNKTVSEITSGMVQQYRVHRMSGAMRKRLHQSLRDTSTIAKIAQMAHWDSQ